MKTKLIAGLAALALVVVLIGAAIGGYNRLVGLQEAVDSQWAQVENVYQRRADLVPNLVETVRGAAEHERETLTAVIEARKQAVAAAQTTGHQAPTNPAQFEQYQKAQDALSNAMSRLLVTVERYPDLKAVAAFRDLMTQLEGTENRISVERMRYNEVARAFDVERRRFPTVLVAAMAGDRFEAKPYFKAREGSESAPQVKFP